MGLIKALAGLPLAPLRGVAGLAEHIRRQAEQEHARELADLQAELLELQFRQDESDLGEADLAQKETHLLEKIGALVGAVDAGERG